MTQVIRKVIQKDIPALKKVLDSSALFPSVMLDDMIADYLNDNDSEDIWFTAVENDKPIAIGYCAPEKLTTGTYNLYAIAIHNDYQGKGIGGKMMHFIENLLRSMDGRILIVETSGTADFALTRKFYETCNYKKEAVVRDFYEEGDHKVVFWKKLTLVR